MSSKRRPQQELRRKMDTLCVIKGAIESKQTASVETTDHSLRLSPQAFGIERPITQAPPTQRHPVMPAPKPHESNGHTGLTIRGGSELSPSRFQTTELWPPAVLRERASITSEPSSSICASSTTTPLRKGELERLIKRFFERSRNFEPDSSKPSAFLMAATPLPLFQEALLNRIWLKPGSSQAKPTLRCAAVNTIDQMNGLAR